MSDPQDVYEAIYNGLKSSRSRKSMEALQQVCQEHFDSGAVNFRISTIAKLGANRGVPSAQTIRNKTGDHYRALLDAWQKLGDKRKNKNNKHIIPTGKYDWVERITNPSERFLVLDMIAQVRSLTEENRKLTSIKKLDIDYRTNSEKTVEKQLLILLDHEIDALKSAIDENFLKRQGWTKGDRGCIKDEQGKIVFKNGWINVIEKVLSINNCQF